MIFAVLTSVAAFTPLLFIPGNIGEIWMALPVIIIGNMITTAILILLVPALMTIYLRANSRRRTAVAAEPQQTPTGSREETAGLV